ncbi:g2169 [Coccomyxa viridis]|uniref:G2169 protein n=1 Tax=Coccomyxa viridis TaxID=1274662 RepID=A0ABP1FLC6_9CHLO
MFLLALFIFGIRLQQAQNILPQREPPTTVRKEWLKGGENQEAVDLDEWLGSSETHPEGGMLSQKLLKKLGLEGAGRDNAIDTQTSADDTADDEPDGVGDGADAAPRGKRAAQRRQRRKHARQPLRPGATLRRGPYGQATAVMRERGLGAVDNEGRDYASDVTTEQQKALSGVAKRGGQQQPNAHLDRRAGRQGRPKEVTEIASSAGQGHGSDEEDASMTADHFNSSAQFAESGTGQSQEATLASVKSAAAGIAGALLKQVGMKGAQSGSALGDSAVGAQRAAQKFKLPSGKVESAKAGAETTTGSREEQDELELPNLRKHARGGGLPLLGQKQQRVGIDEVVAHTNRPDFVANTDPELRMWDALDAGTHEDTLQDAILDHMQVDETIGFADDEDPSDGLVSDRRDEGAYLEEPDKESAVMAEGLPKVDESYADVRVVGGENMADERPITEGLELFDTGVEPVKEPVQAVSGSAQDKGAKGKSEEPYAEDTTDDSVHVTGSSEGGSGMWGWLKGLGGSKGQKSAHEIYKETTGELRGQAGFSGQLNVGEGASS